MRKILAHTIRRSRCRATSILKHQRSNNEQEASHRKPQISIIKCQPPKSFPFQNISSLGTPRAGPPIRESASSRRNRGPQVHGRGLKAPGERRRFFKFRTHSYPFRTTAETPRKSTKSQLALGVARGTSVETGAKNQKRQNDTIKPM